MQVHVIYCILRVFRLIKRGSVIMLEEDFGIEYNLENVYKMMDKLDDGVIVLIEKLGV